LSHVVAAAARDQVVAAARRRSSRRRHRRAACRHRPADQSDAAGRERPVADIGGAADARIGIAGIDRDVDVPAARMLAKAD
jgi:hypothetical protein